MVIGIFISIKYIRPYLEITLIVNDIRLTANDPSADIITVKDGSSTITLSNAVIEGDIVGEENFDINVSGNGTSQVTGEISNATINLSKGYLAVSPETLASENTVLNLISEGRLKMANNVIENYVINELHSTDSSHFTIDLNLTESIADTISVGEKSQGDIILESFNVIGSLDGVGPGSNYTVRILDAKNSNIKLKLSETLLSALNTKILLGREFVVDSIDKVKAVSKSSDSYYYHGHDEDVYGMLMLKKVQTDDDSLYLHEFDVRTGEYRTILGDTLKLVAQLEDADRSFEFNQAYNDNSYTVIEDIGTVSAGKLQVNGVKVGDNSSVLDFDKYLGFSLPNETELTISDVDVVNINNKNGSFVTVSNPNSILNLNNVKLVNTTSTNAIINSGTLNMAGGNVVLETGVYGIGKTNIINGAIAEFKDGASITQREVNVNNGSLILSDNSVISGVLDVKEAGNVRMNARALSSAVNNEGAINLTGGNLNYNITGDGQTNIEGDVVNNAKVDNRVDIKSGSFKSTLDKLSAAINNAAKFTTSGVLNKNITGLGETVLDGTLTIKPESSIEGTLNVNDNKINVSDNKITGYNIGEIKGDGSLMLDMDFATEISDKFITSSSSSGTLCISSINFQNLTDMKPTTKIQVLDTNGGDSLRLSLSSEIAGVNYKMGRTSRYEEDPIVAVINYSDVFKTYNRGGDVYGNLTLGMTSTVDDSVVVNINDDETVWDSDRIVTGSRENIFLLWNALDTDENKKFEFNSSDESVTLANPEITGMGEVKGSSESIIGVSTDEKVKSTINLNSKSGFEINNDVNFSLSDVKLTGAENLITVNNEGAVINLKNSYIDGNIKANKNYDMNISGKDVTTLNGTLNNVNATLQSGTLKFNNNTFASTDSALSVEGGEVSFLDKKTDDYIINDLTSLKNASYSIDIDLKGKAADTITTLTSGNGIVKLGNVCVTGVIDNPDLEYKIQILKGETEGLQLDLSDEIKSQWNEESYLLGTRVINTSDAVKEYTKWDEKLCMYSQKEYTYGSLQLAKTVTENDSIGLKVKETTTDDIVNKGAIGDTLALVNTSTKYPDKHFVFASKDDEYIAGDKLGQTKGSLTISGVKKDQATSVINLNSKSGFELTSGNKIVIDNTTVINGNAEKGSVINAQEEGATIVLTNSSLINNTSTGTNGAAIYSKSDVTVNADSHNVKIQGNNTSTSNEAIYMGENATLILNAKNDSKIDINDKINGEDGYKTIFDGDKSGWVNLNDKLMNSVVELNSITLHLSDEDNFRTSSVAIKSGVLDLINNQPQNQTAQSFSVLGDFKLNVDADLANMVMDRLPENTVVSPNAFINVDRINLLSDAKGSEVAIPFAHSGYKNNVKYIGPKQLSKLTQLTTAYAPIYKYSLRYDNSGDLGYFVFKKGAGASLSNSGAFNPAILASSVAAQAGGYATMNETFNYVFEHSDEFSTLPDCCRQYVHNGKNAKLADCVKRYNCNKYREGATWFRPYVNFESIGLHNGPKVTVTSYGSLVGADSEYINLKNDWGTVGTIYVGYNGSNQNYTGVSTSQNGGLVGYTQTFYKDDFFTALTASVGASTGDSSTMYGKDDFTMLMTGIASKTGYNFGFKEGKYILQPQLFMSYTFVNTFDYTNAAGVRIDSTPLNTLQIHPAVKFAANFENGWHPYLAGGFVLNLLNQTNVNADGYKLPELSMKPYAEYGFGVMKQWGDALTGNFAVMLRNGGRNGVSLTMNFRYIIGEALPKPISNIKKFMGEHVRFSLKK